MGDAAKVNCWEAVECGHGPSSAEMCPAASDTTSDGVNGGVNAGRICWTVTGTCCFGQPQASFVDKLDTCLDCSFFQTVKAEEGDEFRLLKLGQGVRDAPGLHATIARIESFLQIHEELYAEFDLRRLIEQLTDETQRTVSAERSVVFLMEGDPPVLRGEMRLRGKAVPVSIPVDETSAVGSAALHNRVVNVRDPYREAKSGNAPPAFNEDFDRQCNVRTHSLLAVPIRGSGGKPIGVITAANNENGVFSADDQWFMEKYALQAGLAMEKARLLEDSLLAGRFASFGETIAGLSHCLKGITHALRGLTYIIRQAIESGRPDDVEAACEILDRQVQRVVNLSVAVAAYDLERSGGPASGEVNEIVGDVVSTFGEEAKARAISLATRLDDGLLECMGDRLLIYRCLVNLLFHAFNACPASGGQIVVATENAGANEALIEVFNNGPCPDPKSQAQLDALVSGTNNAHGIGLPTALQLARDGGGHLELQVRPGDGTAYRLRLPLRAGAQPDTPRQA